MRCNFTFLAEIPLEVTCRWNPGDPSVGISPGPEILDVVPPKDVMAYIAKHYDGDIVEQAREELEE